MVTSEQIFKVPADLLYKTIIDYQKYPQFIAGCSKVKVKRENEKILVSYSISVAGQEAQYTLLHTENPLQHVVEWSLYESNFFKKNNGSWHISPLDTHSCKVKYQLDMAFIVPIPQFMLTRVMQTNLKTMLLSFEKHTMEIMHGS